MSEQAGIDYTLIEGDILDEVDSRGKGTLLKAGFMNRMQNCTSLDIKKDLAMVCSKGKSSRDGHGREPLIDDEFIFNVVHQGLQELFKEDFENFMGMFHHAVRRRPIG